MSLGKGQLRETRTVAEAVFFFSCLFSNFLCGEKERGRGGKEREGPVEGLKQDSAVK